MLLVTQNQQSRINPLFASQMEFWIDILCKYAKVLWELLIIWLNFGVSYHYGTLLEQILGVGTPSPRYPMIAACGCCTIYVTSAILSAQVSHPIMLQCSALTAVSGPNGQVLITHTCSACISMPQPCNWYCCWLGVVTWAIHPIQSAKRDHFIPRKPLSILLTIHMYCNVLQLLTEQSQADSENGANVLCVVCVCVTQKLYSKNCRPKELYIYYELGRWAALFLAIFVYLNR